MASWQPPIPSGALYSKPARQLGPALALLAYCYDLVQRDGTATVLLKDVAAAMEEPYPNVKRWWCEVRVGPWFAEVADRGKRGFVVTFNPDWLDWRILSTRREAPTMKDKSRTNEGSEMSLHDVEGQIKDKSRTNEGSEMSLHDNVYKEDHDNNTTSSPTPSAREENVPAPNPEMVMMLFEFGFQSVEAVNDIARMGLDLETVRTSISNLLADTVSIGAIAKRLRLHPPVRGQPYARTQARSTGPPKRDTRLQAALERVRARGPAD